MLIGSALLALGAAAGTLAYGVRAPQSSLLAPSVYRGSTGRRSLALTFDDGPSESTPALLELLDHLRIPATFFQCGYHVRRLPGIARQVLEAGHEIGNHTTTHAALYRLSARQIHAELAETQTILMELTGSMPCWFRAPYGARWFGLRSAQKACGLTGVMWTTIGRDWVLPAEGVANRILRGASPGGILCLHDGRELQHNPRIDSTIAAVRRVVPLLLNQGYRFETVSQLVCPTSVSE